jgi:hypothetical protein
LLTNADSGGKMGLGRVYHGVPQSVKTKAHHQPNGGEVGRFRFRKARELGSAPGVGEILAGLGQEWANAAKRYQRDMLRVISEAVYVDILGKRLVCVKPYPQFAPLFRTDGLKERNGCYYVADEGQTRSED